MWEPSGQMKPFAPPCESNIDLDDFGRIAQLRECTMALASTPIYISSPDPSIAPFKPGMRRLVLQSGSLSRGTLTRCYLLLTLPMGSTSFRGLGTELPCMGLISTCFHPALFMYPNLSCFLCNARCGWLGSGTQRAAYYAGYPTTFVKV